MYLHLFFSIFSNTEDNLFYLNFTITKKINFESYIKREKKKKHIIIIKSSVIYTKINIAYSPSHFIIREYIYKFKNNYFWNLINIIIWGVFSELLRGVRRIRSTLLFPKHNSLIMPGRNRENIRKSRVRKNIRNK